jgi:hypothetical protein
VLRHGLVRIGAGEVGAAGVGGLLDGGRMHDHERGKPRASGRWTWARQRAITRLLVRWLMACAACLAAWPAAAAPPAAGQVVSGAIEVRALKRLPLPPGRWKVENTFEETVALESSTTSANRATYVVVLANEDPAADLLALVLDFTDSAAINWTGQPCDNSPANNPPLVTNTLGTNSSSLRVRCNRVYAFANLRSSVRSSSSAWFTKRFGPMRERADMFPVHGLTASGYVSAPRSDRVWVNVYANPARHGLDGEPGATSPFRAIDSAGSRAPALREYLKAFADWFDGYTHAIDNAYLGGRSPGGETAAAFQFGTAQAGTAARPAAVQPPGAAAAPAHAAAAAPAGAPAATPATPALAPALAQGPSAGPTPAAQVPAAAAVAPQKVHAMVIGNGAYTVAALSNPRNDARAMAERFRRFGFTVSTLLDGSRKQMVQALSRFADTARDADVSIVFYAGHGVQVNGVNYLIPVDMDLASARAVGVTYEAVSLSTLLEHHLPGRAKLVFLDACRDNPLARSLAGTRGSGGGLAAVNAAAGTLISYATRDGSTASDGAGTHSPYTAALLAHLDEGEDISIVLRRVRQRVMTSTGGAQEPWEYGSLVGDKLVLSQISRPR